jgi:hypothetical protein
MNTGLAIAPVQYSFMILFLIWRARPTVCVTCGGAGTAKPSNQKKAKARKMLGM